jgi:hypothetical protein
MDLVLSIVISMCTALLLCIAAHCDRHSLEAVHVVAICILISLGSVFYFFSSQPNTLTKLPADVNMDVDMQRADILKHMMSNTDYLLPMCRSVHGYYPMYQPGGPLHPASSAHARGVELPITPNLYTHTDSSAMPTPSLSS